MQEKQLFSIPFKIRTDEYESFDFHFNIIFIIEAVHGGGGWGTLARNVGI